MPRPRGAQLVEAKPCHHHHQPRANVVDPLQVDSHEPGERLLDHVLRVVDAAEHPVGHVEQQAAVLAPHASQPIVGVQVPFPPWFAAHISLRG